MSGVLVVLLAPQIIYLMTAGWISRFNIRVNSCAPRLSFNILLNPLLY